MLVIQTMFVGMTFLHWLSSLIAGVMIGGYYLLQYVGGYLDKKCNESNVWLFTTIVVMMSSFAVSMYLYYYIVVMNLPYIAKIGLFLIILGIVAFTGYETIEFTNESIKKLKNKNLTEKRKRRIIMNFLMVSTFSIMVVLCYSLTNELFGSAISTLFGGIVAATSAMGISIKDVFKYIVNFFKTK